MFCHSFAPTEFCPGLTGCGPDTALEAYCRGRTGLLADDGARWAALILPGGSYRRIAPAEGEPVALAFAAAGVQAFVLRYSVLPARWPQPFWEAACAMAFLRDRAEELGFAPNRVAVCGFSAGGHLAGWLAGHWNDPALDGLGLTPEQVRPDAAILAYPVVHQQTLLEPVGDWQALRLDGPPVPNHPPVFLWATGEDRTVPAENTLDYTLALRRGGVPLELHLFARGPHAMGLADRESARDEEHYNAHAAAWHGLCVDWLRRREG